MHWMEDKPHGIEPEGNDIRQHTRRNFLKTSAATSAWLLLSASGIGALAGCGSLPDWKPVSYPKTLLHNLWLFDGVSGQLQADRIILIESGRIRDILSWGDLSQYGDYKLVDLKGRTVLPGLIDNHVHITVPFMYKVNLTCLRQMNPQIELNFRNCILNGVTTVRDVGGFPGKIKKYRALADANIIPGPRVISSLSPIATRDGDTLGAPPQAPYFTNPVIKWIIGGNYAERPVGIDEIRAACEEMISLGAQWLKTLHQSQTHTLSARPLPNHTEEGFRTILEVGREHGIKCAMHQPFLDGFHSGVTLGYHTLEHIPTDGIIPDDDIEAFIQKDMAILPTIMAFGDAFIYDNIIDLMKRMEGKQLMSEAVAQMSDRIRHAETMDHQESFSWYIRENFPHVLTNLKKLYQRGATIGIGTDMGGTPSGFFGRYTEELKHFARAGIPNDEILMMATSINARILEMDDKIGSVKKGLMADLIAVEGNPLEDLAALDRIQLVMKGGLFVSGI